MAAILMRAYNGYKFLFDEIVDQKVKSWPLLGNPIPGLALLGVYFMFIFKWGPKFMETRQPYNLKKVLIVYNAFQVVACAHIFYTGAKVWGWQYRWVCEPVDYSDNEDALLIARTVYYYFLLKVVDLLDTVFFVVRKKYNQVSFLHVYHHSGMVLLSWGAANYFPGGHGTIVGVINSFVHVVMYSYYLLTTALSLDPATLWWKKYITQLQIIQFLYCVIHFAIIVPKADCAYPRWIAAIFLPQNLFMFILFVDFYIKAYIKKPNVKPAATTRRPGDDDHHHEQSDNGVVTKQVETNGFLVRNRSINVSRNVKLRP